MPPAVPGALRLVWEVTPAMCNDYGKSHAFQTVCGNLGTMCPPFEHGIESSGVKECDLSDDLHVTLRELSFCRLLPPVKLAARWESAQQSNCNSRTAPRGRGTPHACPQHPNIAQRSTCINQATISCINSTCSSRSYSLFSTLQRRSVWCSLLNAWSYLPSYPVTRGYRYSAFAVDTSATPSQPRDPQHRHYQ